MINIFLAIFLFLVGCGEAASSAPQSNGTTIVIESDRILVTPNITAAAGAAVPIVNHDTESHTITSQSAENSFDDNGTFDVLIPAQSTQVLTLPNAPIGTVFFYYSRFDTDLLNPSSGTITIE